MAQANYFSGDVVIAGNLIARSMVIPAGTITDASVANNAAIAASKSCHRAFRGHSQSGTATSTTLRSHIATAAGSINGLIVSAVTAATGAATVTVDLKKNGASVLGAIVTLNSSTTTPVAAAITSPAYAVGDIFDIVIVATASTGALPSGLLIEPAFDENPS